ncbi:hypothetical protein V2A60_006031 [Cordyceps javanica]
MPSSDIKQVASEQSARPARPFPEWTQEDDSDVEIASVAEKQRVRFRAASVAGRQRHKAPLRELPATLTRKDISQEAHEIRAILQGRKLGDVARGFGAATSSLARGVGSAVGAVAEGIGHSGSAAASAFAKGEGLAGAASAAAGSVSNGIAKGVSAEASAVSDAESSVSSAISSIFSSESESSENESKTKTKKKEETPKTQEPSSTIETTETPQVTSTSMMPPRPPPPAIKTSLPPPKTTENAFDNIPPPKAEQPSSKSSDGQSSTDSPSKTSYESPPKSSDSPSPTSTEGDQKISLSVLVPGATVSSESGTRLILTPVLTSSLPGITSGAKKVTTGINNGTTMPFAMVPGPTTMSTSVATKSNSAPGGRPSTINPTRPELDRDGSNASRSGLSTGGQDALISIGVLVAVCSFFAIGYYFWRKGKKRMDSDHGGSFRAMIKPQLDAAKRGVANVASRIPYIRDRFYNKSWNNLDDSYGGRFTEKRLSSSTSASVGPLPTTKESSRLDPIKVQTTFEQRSSFNPQLRGTSAVGGTVSSAGVSTMGVSALGISSVGDITVPAAAIGRSAESGNLVAAPGSNSNPLGLSPFADPSDREAQPPRGMASQSRQLAGSNHDAKPSLSSITPQYNLTLLSAMGTRRMSEASSLSSGFGDGDIVVPSKQMRKSTRTSKLHNVTNSADVERNRQSTATTVADGGSTRRDTVYTEASEDSPPRFRTVSSWVRQQSVRVKREKQREQAAADESGTPPPVPPIPPEQEFRLMMPDGEVPRRVEDTNADGADWSSQTQSILSRAGGGTIGAAR